ncbi:MAG: O-antigen ligase family protein [Rhizonema sp. PD37]|nr:O-antigen ligase family protein [Rhizonema sp. PD37]
MFTNELNRHSRVIWLTLAGISIGAVAGFTAGVNPLYLFLPVVAVPIVVYFFTHFEQAVLNLLAVRTCLDPFSGKQIPAIYALGMDGLTLLYVTITLLRGRRIYTDSFWWFFVGWVLLQGLWVILLPLEGVGLNADYLPGSIREWIRLFSWVMIYLLVMQLKDRLPPQKAIAWLFLSLVIPVTVALMQMFVPFLLPDFLNGGGAIGAMPVAEISRIKGTMGHPNAFATTLLLFISLTYWKLTNSFSKFPWFLIMGLLALCFVSTKALTGLTMLAAFVLVLVIPRLSFLNLIGGALFFAVIIGLFANSDFGRERLGSLSNTPLLNPDLDTSRAILLSQGDNNSFNWRLAQWTFLMSKIFPQSPFLGFGLGLSIEAGGNGYLPHNDYIRALIEGGITGFVTYMGFFIAQGIRLIQLIRAAPPKSPQRNLCVILLAVMFAMLAGMLSDNIWSHTILFSYWFTALAIAGWNWDDAPSSLATHESRKNSVSLITRSS